MEQRKRHGGNSGLGYYTSWEKGKENGCIYCGNSATTREHVPSKAFLIEPFPENLSTIPACFECNNGFSADENYVSCFLDVLKSFIYADYSCNESTKQRLLKDEKLKQLIDEQIKLVGKEVHFSYDEKRLLRILEKLAVGHAGFEFDKVDFDRCVSISYDFIFNLSDEQISNFNIIPTHDTIVEISSRVGNTPCIIQNIDTGEAYFFNAWNEVQENQYRYQVYQNNQGGVSVKIVIYELLYCCADFM